MNLKYTITGRQLYDFQIRFAKHLSAKAVPAWLRQLISWGSIGVFGLLCVLFSQNLERAFFLWWLSLILVTATNYFMQELTAKAYAKYYERLPGALTWDHKVVDGRLITTNRDVEISFPIDSTASISKDAEFLYVEFNDRGRVRILLTAFSSPTELEEFERLFKKDNKT